MNNARTLLWSGVIAAFALSGAAYAKGTKVDKNTTQAKKTDVAKTNKDKAPSFKDLLAYNDAAPQQDVADTATDNDQNGQETQKLGTIIVSGGLRASVAQSVQEKRFAHRIQDSITATDIGALPDRTITDSLQRIPGVQIDRSAGEGSSLNIRGLPQVGTTINGEVFLPAGNIVSNQPSFTDVPSELISGADVIKSSTANMSNAGISGTVNLKTWRPFELKSGTTLSATVDATHGNYSNKTQPEGNVLFGYNDDNQWGIVASAAFSDVTHENSYKGSAWSPQAIHGEDWDDANTSGGFIGAYANSYWTGKNAYGIPSSLVSKVKPGVGIDVNGNGKYNDAFSAGTHNLAMQEELERKRSGISASFQANLGSAFQLTADGFYTKLVDLSRDRGVLMASTTWQAGNWIPLVSRNTGDHISGEFNNGGHDLVYNTTQKYKKWVGEFSPFTQVTRNDSHSRNFSVGLTFDNGGPFTGDVHLVSDSADALSNNAYVQFSDTDGALWPNKGLTPGKMYVPTSDSPSGVITFNPNGHAPAEVPMTFDTRGGMSIDMPDSMRKFIQDPDNFRVKTIEDGQNSAYQRKAGINVVRLDGKYDFRNESNLNLEFGLRNSVRTARNETFQMVAPIGDKANGGPCDVRYFASDVILNGDCKVDNGTAGHYIHANTYAGTPLSQMPGTISNNIKNYSDFAGVDINTFGLDPKAMDHPDAFVNQLFPGTHRDPDPAQTWDLVLRESTGYLQLDFDEGAIQGNVGINIVHTVLDVNQHSTGQSCCTPGMNAVDLGKVNTSRSYWDYLPRLNLSIGLSDDWKFRFAYSKNMMPLSLDQWGGGFAAGYSYDASINGFKVVSANSYGNPQLKPWRSRNVDASFEYYGEHTTASIGAFDIAVESFISNGSVRNCNLPDLDGTVRRCVPVNSLVQGSGAELHGFEAGVQQNLTFLPGIWGNFGFNANYTYSPSATGSDIAGNTIPFQDNSKNQANLVLWYQDSHLQVRLAGNYRSKRAVAQNHNGVTGFEEYQAPVTYLDASIRYKITPRFSIFLNGRNLTKKGMKLYLTYPDQVLQNYRYDTRYTLGVRFSL